MGVAPENTCLSQEAGAAAAKVAPAKDKAADPLSYDALLQEYNQLRERSTRTTNALGSAAHDLKTPLSILNGYIELLQNEKLGPLNERQREILADMHASGQRLQHFIQDFLSYTVLETGEMKMRYETGNVQAVLDGDLDAFMQAELERLAAGNVKRVVRGMPAGESLWEIEPMLEMKTVWHPVGV